jgi:hypothetical protein
MSSQHRHQRDLLGELQEEAGWAERIGRLREGSPAEQQGELDALLEALVQAQRLRRHLCERLARARDAGEGGHWRELPMPAPLRRAGDREAS